MSVIFQWLFGSTPPPQLFVRDIQVERSIRVLLFTDAFTAEDRLAFADLLLRLDGDPIKHTFRISVEPPIPGLRWASFARHKAIIFFDPAHNRVRIVKIEHSP